MELQGKWSKDEDGYMEFESSQLQRMYEAITDSYHQVYNGYLEELDDDDEAYYKALQDGYQMVTDYKTINGDNQFVTTYLTPYYELDVWYETDLITNKRDYTKGFMRVNKKQ